jgi:hypothetical protein
MQPDWRRSVVLLPVEVLRLADIPFLTRNGCSRIPLTDTEPRLLQTRNF